MVGTRTCWGEPSLHPRETYAKELIRANEVLRNRVEEQNTLLEAAAHDLKNPFFGIRALAELVLENEGLSPAVERKVTLIRQSAVEALNHIDDLLRLAAEAAEQKHALSTVDAGALAQRVTDGFEPQAERKGQDLRCTVAASGDCVVQGDRARLREALSNLVSNALKYSPPDTRIDVDVERDGDAVRMAVTDQGPGLSDEEQGRLFLPFHRLSPQPTGDESASGLGLYLVWQIMEQHDGQVEVESTPGEGSTFALVLPAAPGDAAEA